MKFAADVHGIQRMNLHVCSDPRDHSCSTIIRSKFPAVLGSLSYLLVY